MRLSRSPLIVSAQVRRLLVPLSLAVIAAAANAAIYVAVYAPSRLALERADAAWRDGRDLIARYKTYQQTHEEVTSLISQATAREDLPKVVTTLASWAKRRGLRIPEVNYQPEKLDLKDFQKVGLSFSVSGPYGDVRRFLDDLERSSPFLAVESLSLGRARGEEGRLEMQVKVAAYLRTT